MGNPILSPQNRTAPQPVKRSTGGKPTAKPPSSLQLLMHFARQHPFISLFAVWIAFLFFGWLAIKGLTYTNPAPLEVIEAPQPAAESPTHSAGASSAIGLLAIVVVTCATSSILISRRLRPAPASPRRIVKRRTANSSKRSASKPANSIRSDDTPSIPSRMSIALLSDPEKTTTPPLNLAQRLDIRQQERRSKQF